MINSKRKGNKFELDIAKKLSLFLSEGVSDDWFGRSQNSGGRQTIRKKSGKDTHNQDGDITVVHMNAAIFGDVYTVECKHYKNIELWGLLTGANSNIVTFWNQVCQKALEVNKKPILIAKQNHKPTLFVTSGYVGKQINDYFGIKPLMKSSVGYDDLCFYLLDDVLDFDPVVFMKMT
ncbi:MAG: hypothetical protein KAS32_05875, partial [Candidatus Peribacteraceae bacterium]|nr:hypothetical protein [Candidatus Peribacteraceae bacterium]